MAELGLGSYDDGIEKAIRIMEKLQWSPTGSAQSSKKQYMTLRCAPNNIKDFDWLVKYISHSGCHAELLERDSDASSVISNPYAMMQKTVGDSTLQCTKVNSDYTVDIIYRFPNSELENDKIIRSRYAKFQNTSSAGNLSTGTYSKVKLYENKVEDIEAEEVIDVPENNDNTDEQGYVTIGSIEVSIGVGEGSYSSDNKRAVKILEMQKWVKLSSLDKGRTMYACRKEDSPNPDDFKWVVGYLSGRGTPENPKNPHTYVYTEMDGVEYKSIKVNKFFEGTIIYKMGDAVSLGHSKNNSLVEKRLKEDPVFQYNLELIEEYKQEMKEKIAEYNRLKAQKDDEIIISQSASGMIDLEDLNERLDELREEIEDLKADIEDLKEENEEIREDFEDNVMDEEVCPSYCPPVERKRVLYKECQIAGITFHDVEDIWDELYVGAKLALVRQKDNKYDNNAIAIALAEDYEGNPDNFDFDCILGYVPRKQNSHLASMMDKGMADKVSIR